MRSNSDPGVFPEDPMVDGIKITWPMSDETLFEVHRLRVARWAHRTEPRIIPETDSVLGFLQHEWRSELDAVAAAGYYTLDPADDRFTMTLRGTYLMTWRLLWPLKQLRRRRRRRQAVRVLRELNLTRLLP